MLHPIAVSGQVFIVRKPSLNNRKEISLDATNRKDF